MQELAVVVLQAHWQNYATTHVGYFFTLACMPTQTQNCFNKLSAAEIC